jgi:hypothetical protein
MAEVTTPQLREMALERAPQYYTNFPYHNYDGHVRQTYRDFEVIYDWLDAHGIPIDFDEGIIGLAYHDAGFHKDHKALGFDTKEEYAKSIAQRDLNKFGAPKRVINTVGGIILATTANLEPKTNLEKAVRLADVGNVSGDPTTFLYNTYLLMQEAVRRGLPIPETIEQFCSSSQSFLELYFKNSVEFEHKGKVVKYEPMTGIAQRNIRTLGQMTVKTFSAVIRDIDPLVEKTLPKIWFNK